MKKLTTDDYLACAFFTVLAFIFLGLAYIANNCNSVITAIVLVFIACCSFCGSIWSLSEFKNWK